MKKEKLSIKSIPGWVYTLVIFGFLYLSGLHTEAIGQVQRALLATGIIKPKFPEITDSKAVTPAIKLTEAEDLANDFMLQDLNGNSIKFSSLKNKVVFLNFWATWCPPCIAEMPGIQGLYDKLKENKNIAFVLVSVDQDGINKVPKFISRKGYTFPAYLPTSHLPPVFQTNAIPATFILDKNGKIAARHDGMADYDTKEIKAYLENLAK